MDAQHPHIAIETSEDRTVHLMGAIMDSTLCGLEISGDESLGIQPGAMTTSKIDCPQCVQILKYCWGVKWSDLAGVANNRST